MRGIIIQEPEKSNIL